MHKYSIEQFETLDKSDLNQLSIEELKIIAQELWVRDYKVINHKHIRFNSAKELMNEIRLFLVQNNIEDCHMQHGIIDNGDAYLYDREEYIELSHMISKTKQEIIADIKSTVQAHLQSIKERWTKDEACSLINKLKAKQ